MKLSNSPFLPDDPCARFPQTFFLFCRLFQMLVRLHSPFPPCSRHSSNPCENSFDRCYPFLFTGRRSSPLRCFFFFLSVDESVPPTSKFPLSAAFPTFLFLYACAFRLMCTVLGFWFFFSRIVSSPYCTSVPFFLCPRSRACSFFSRLSRDVSHTRFFFNAADFFLFVAPF